jgi:hypothetical protein
MALVLADRVQETSTTSGTGTFTLNGAVSGYQSFATGIGSGNTVYYAIYDATAFAWEIGLGTFTGPSTLTRTTVFSNSLGTTAFISFAGNTSSVFATYPGSKAVSTDTLATPPAIGGTTPAAGTFTTLIGGSGSANYEQITGGATGKAVQFQTLGTDANISVAVQPKGTGAIDLAAGSSGVNISNGGTVTAITGTSGGSYTTVPTFTVSAPTTASGTQATGTCAMAALTTTLQAGGSGYAIGDTITLTGGTFSQAIILTVATLSGSAVATFTTTNGGTYTVLPTNPISQGSTSGSGTGATFNVTAWQVRTTAYTITAAGSGYVEQPTITFSSGTAAAYATVGSGTVIRSLGSTGNQSLDFYTPQSNTSSIPAFRLRDTVADSYPMINNLSSLATIVAQGNGNAQLGLAAAGSGSVNFYTSGTSLIKQMVVSHTASAVNYVQATGAVTTGSPVISAQGSDGNVGLRLSSKGNFNVSVWSGNNTYQQFGISGANNSVNYLQVSGNIASNAPVLSAQGTDGNIDLTLTPKGTGRVNITTSIKPKVNSASNVTSPLAWDSTSYDEYAITALANALTINADANASPADGQKMMFRFKDNGTARALTWTTGSTNSFRVVGVTLPTTTVASKLVYIGCIYNAADSRWDAVAVSQEA